MKLSSAPAGAAGNRLLAALPPQERDRLLAAFDVVPLNLAEVVYQPAERVRYVYFVTKGIIATVVRMEDGRTAEAGMVGPEGMVCACTFLECDRTPFQGVVENPGEALRMSVRAFQAEVRHSPTLHRLMHRYVDAFLCMVSQSAACNALHTLEQRCARWLLMTQDRAEPDHFLLTQDSLAQKLGASRTSVTEVAHSLQDGGLIRYSRGKITVLDRKGLEETSCECYRRIRAKFDALPSGRCPG